MPLPVDVDEVVDFLQMQSDLSTSYVNRVTGELAVVMEDELLSLAGAEEEEDLPEWQVEAMAEEKRVLDSDDFVALPDRFEIHEYRIMEDFCDSLGDERTGRMLAETIQGRGAFRRFKDAVRREGIADDWYAFQRAAFRRIAIDFLEAEGIPYQQRDAAAPGTMPGSG